MKFYSHFHLLFFQLTVLSEPVMDIECIPKQDEHWVICWLSLTHVRIIFGPRWSHTFWLWTFFPAEMKRLWSNGVGQSKNNHETVESTDNSYEPCIFPESAVEKMGRLRIASQIIFTAPKLAYYSTIQLNWTPLFDIYIFVWVYSLAWMSSLNNKHLSRNWFVCFARVELLLIFF